MNVTVTEKKFIVVVGKTNREFLAQDEIKDLLGDRVVVVLPTVKATRRVRWLSGAQKLVTVDVPMFPNYFFAWFKNMENWPLISRCKSVAGVLSQNERPILVPSLVVEELQTRQDRIDAADYDSLPLGSAVMIMDGSLKGTAATYCGRGWVEMNMFGRLGRVKVPVELLELL